MKDILKNSRPHNGNGKNGNNGDHKNGNGNNSDGPKYKFLFISWETLSGDLAWTIRKEGHEVKAYIKYEDDVYDGFLDKVRNWKSYVEWADVIVFDDVGFGAQADKLRKAGKAVVGGSSYMDKLEDDREFGQSEMKKAGMLTLPNWNFSDYDEALKFIKDNPGRYVYKPSGFVPGDWRGLLFMGKEEDGNDLYEMLDSNKEVIQKKIKTFQLQKFATGVEVGVSAFFNGHDFIYPLTIAFEHKRLFPGELGPMTGEMGTSMFWSEPNNFFRSTLEKMKGPISESGYVGYVDINCILNARGIYPLEFTCRFGYPTISIQQEGVLSEWGEFLHAIANGQQYRLKTKKGFQIGVVCATPPFPYDDPSEIEIYKDSSILFKKPSKEGCHLGDIKVVDGIWKVAGYSGYDLVVTGSGATMEEARRQTYSRIDNIMLQNMFYRTDIGASWPEDRDKLHTWGYLDLEQ